MIKIRQAVIMEAQRRNLSGYALAKLAGIPVRMVQRFIAGERDVTTAKADALLSALGFKLQRPRRHTKG